MKLKPLNRNSLAQNQLANPVLAMFHHIRFLAWDFGTNESSVEGHRVFAELVEAIRARRGL